MSDPEHFQHVAGTQYTASPSRETRSVLDMTSEAYVQACLDCRAKGGRPGALQRYSNFFRNGVVIDPLLMPWSDGHRDVVASNTDWAPTAARIQYSECDEGRVAKFTQLVPGRTPTDTILETESVLIPMIGKKGVRTYTLCVSSQVGCAMGCTFCQTAQMGLIRSLTPAEIVAQWFVARHRVLADPAHGLDSHAGITNIVFMGMGEPLDNLANVLTATEILADRRGGGLAMSRITISTVGRIDGIRRLNAKVQEHGWHRLGFAVSLNAPNDQIRSSIMPINRAMPMQELRAAILERPIHGGFKICFEYVLIPGVNDQLQHATELADFVLGRGLYGPSSGHPDGGVALPGLVNVIPYNPRDGSPWPAPEEDRVNLFMQWLAEQGVYAKRRRTKGRDTMAACGQLGNPALRRRPRAALTIGATDTIYP